MKNLIKILVAVATVAALTGCGAAQYGIKSGLTPKLSEICGGVELGKTAVAEFERTVNTDYSQIKKFAGGDIRIYERGYLMVGVLNKGGIIDNIICQKGDASITNSGSNSDYRANSIINELESKTR
ncbi:hypothetical protein [Geotalea sp. SG265]|uniref:LptM family lipoprotein n=1 Tax=Geotalea sp. SG265 TaxID=2922867 RepID=UPI001FAE89B2|nr:hypothetical protein [Geotalea sp. SG265]